jgi:hypothetical protein
VALAPGQHLVLDATLGGVVEDLIAGDAPRAGESAGVIEPLGVEVGEAPPADRAVLRQLLEGGDGVVERMRAGPVEQVEIDLIGAEAAQAPFAGDDGAAPGGVLGEHLADQEDLVAPAGDGLADQLLDRARAVHLRGVEERHPGVEAGAEGAHCLVARIALHVPSPLPEDRDGLAGPAEGTVPHRGGRVAPGHRQLYPEDEARGGS